MDFVNISRDCSLCWPGAVSSNSSEEQQQQHQLGFVLAECSQCAKQNT